MKEFTSEEIGDKIISMYGEEDLDGHGKNHVTDVYNLSMRLLEKKGCDFYADCVRPLTVAAIYHDIFSRVNRKYHATLAAEYVVNDKLDPFLKRLSKRERFFSAYAIYKHRSSDKSRVCDFKNSFGSESALFERMLNDDIDNRINCFLISNILRAADKGLPNLESILVRSIRHTMSTTLNLEIRDASTIVYKHVYEKFGRGGYLYNNSPYYNEVFKNEIDKLWTDIEKLRVEDVEAKIREVMKYERN